jgi:ATP-dependent Clp protease ATP-binding subunit ClpA
VAEVLLLRAAQGAAEDACMASMTEPVPTPRRQRLVAAASEMATDWGHPYVGAEHLFLAIIGDRQAVPTQVLARLTDLDRVEMELRALMESAAYKTPSRRVTPPPERE